VLPIIKQTPSFLHTSCLGHRVGTAGAVVELLS